jgi:hypothetical protein
MGRVEVRIIITVQILLTDGETRPLLFQLLFRRFVSHVDVSVSFSTT